MGKLTWCRQVLKKRLFHDLRRYQANRTFWFGIRNPKSKRNEMEEILDNLLFSYWLLVDNLMSNRGGKRERSETEGAREFLAPKE